MRTVLDAMALEPVTRAFVCCPKCFFLYSLDPDNPKNLPESCTNRVAPKSRACNCTLRKPRNRGAIEVTVPTRKFLYQDLKHWVGWMYGRPDLEMYLDRRHPSQNVDQLRNSNELWDIWDSPTLRDFLGPDGCTTFTAPPGNEGRLVMSLNMDGFNPYGNRTAGKKVSVGAIYMVVLNLPPAIRYNVENIFLVGIIPGPHEPSQQEINYLLRPLVDDLVLFWEDSIYLSRTSLHRNGRRVRIALIPLICDLPASRTMSGFAHFSSTNFCSECHQTLDDINNLEHWNWEPRNRNDHLAHAAEWLAAKTEKKREELLKAAGVRWSELLRLPYWDPTKFTLVDSMHMLYLWILQRHCREIWGMDIRFEDGEGITFDHPKNHPVEEEMKKAHEIWKAGNITELGKLKTPVLRELCRRFNLPFGMKKKKLLRSLVQHVGSWPFYLLYLFLHLLHQVVADTVDRSEDLLNAPATPSYSGDASATTSKKKLTENKHDMTEEDLEHIWLTSSKSTVGSLKRDVLVVLCELKCRRDDGSKYDTSALKVPELKDLVHKKVGFFLEIRKLLVLTHPSAWSREYSMRTERFLGTRKPQIRRSGSPRTIRLVYWDAVYLQRLGRICSG